MNSLRTRTMLSFILIVALGALIGCPTIQIASVTVAKLGKNRIQLVVEVDVDNTANDAGEASSKLSVALDPTWKIEQIRYAIPGEPMVRSARPTAGVAAKTDWTYTTEDVTWWGFNTAEHTVPAGRNIYRVEIDVAVPKKTRTGKLIVVVGDAGPDAVIGAYEVNLKPAKVTPSEPPVINEASQVEMGGGGDFGDMMGGLGGAMDGLGEAGEMLGGLGALFGADTGAAGFRSEYVQQNTADGVVTLANVALTLPDTWSIIADPPEADTTQLALLPPGMKGTTGVDIRSNVGAEDAAAIVAKEAETVAADLTTEGTPPTTRDISRTTPGGITVEGKEFRFGEGEAEGLILLVSRLEQGTLVLFVTVGDTQTEADSSALLDQIIDSTQILTAPAK